MRGPPPANVPRILSPVSLLARTEEVVSLVCSCPVYGRGGSACRVHVGPLQQSQAPECGNANAQIRERTQ